MEERTNPVFYKLCKKIEHLARPKKITIDENAVGEDIEVYSSFRSSVCVTIHACKLEQVALSSDSDSDIEISDCKPSPEKQPKCSYCPLHPAPESCPTDCPLSPTYQPIPPKRQSTETISSSISARCVEKKNHKLFPCPECNCFLKMANIEKDFRKKFTNVSWEKLKDAYNRWILQTNKFGTKTTKNKKRRAKKNSKDKKQKQFFATPTCY